MQTNSETLATIKGLAEKVKDETKPIAERRDALKLICDLRGEPYQAVPEGDLRQVVCAMVYWPSGIEPLSLRAAAEAVQEGRARQATYQRKQ
jgi:hypothetical protein